MRHVLPFLAAFIFAVSLVTGTLALVGCQTSPINGRAVLPASVADVDAVQADVDALRTDTRTSIDAVKTDLTAAKIDTTATGAALGSLDGKIEEAKNRPPTAGVGGGIINALGGELTSRFLLKVATVAVLAGGAFLYYLTDLRHDEKEEN